MVRRGVSDLFGGRLLVAAVVAVVLLPAAAPASAADATFRGLVTDALGVPLSNVCVTAFGASDNRPVEHQTQTDALGLYTLSVTPGSYFVSFGGFTGPCASPYAYEYHGDTYRLNEAKRTVVHDGDTVIANASLKKWGRILGQLTWKSTRKPIENVCVSPEGGSAHSSDVTDAQGRYELTHVPPEQTFVDFGIGPCSSFASFPADVPPTRYSERGDRQKPTLVPVSPGGSTTGIDQALPRGGIVTGRVADKAGRPVRDIRVILFPTGGAGSDTLHVGGAAVSDKHGRYTVRGLGSNDYVVMFDLPGDKDRFYLNASSFSTARLIRVRVAQSYTLMPQHLP